MTVTIPFRAEFKEAMLDSRKTATSRTRQYGKRGDQFEAFGAPFVILQVQKLTLREIADKWFEAEGVESPKAFEAKWAEIHPDKGFIPEQEVFLHLFMRRNLLLASNYWPGNNAYIEQELERLHTLPRDKP
jgi:hypothetical protein